MAWFLQHKYQVFHTKEKPIMTSLTITSGNSTAASATIKTDPSREARFQQLIGIYMHDLFRYAYWLTHDKSVAEDLVQETLSALNEDRLSQETESWELTTSLEHHLYESLNTSIRLRVSAIFG